MSLATVLTPEVAKSAGVAYVHYLSFMLCFAALVVERRLLGPNPDRRTATAMVITDIIYGIAALALLLSGILRVLYFGQGSDFYTTNPCSGGRSACIYRLVPCLYTQLSLISSGRFPCVKVNSPRCLMHWQSDWD